MAKDGSRRGGARPGAGRKPKALTEKIAEGRPAEVMMEPAELEGVDVPPVKDFLKSPQKSGRELVAEEVYQETYAWLKARGCEKLVTVQMVEQYAMSVSRWIQCEEIVSSTGFLAKHPTTGAAIASPYTINREKSRILAGFEEIRDTAFETGELEAEARQLNGEMNVAAELIQKCIGENARVAQNQGEYAKRYDALVERFETAKARLEEVQAAITEKQAQRKMMENFMEELRGLPEQVDYFYEGAWYAMVDFVTVYGKEDVRFNFKNGMEIPVKTK